MEASDVGASLIIPIDTVFMKIHINLINVINPGFHLDQTRRQALKPLCRSAALPLSSPELPLDVTKSSGLCTVHVLVGAFFVELGSASP